MNTPGPTVQATRTSLEIVEALVRLNGAGVTELASDLDLPKSTVHNHLNTLHDAEYVVKDDGAYDVGLRFLKLGEYSRSRLKLHDVARPEIDSLAEETGELVNLSVEEYGRGVYLYLAQGEQAVHLDTHAGMHVHLHCTALGKAILAHTPEERVEEILDTMGMPARTEHTITGRDAFFEELDAVRDRGYAYDRQERLDGLRCVAAPITTPDHGVAGAISISGPTSRMQGERFETEIPDLLRNAANVVELNMTYS
ncbi:transcriptional regulator, IclR family [Halarchaeum acidiphilum MH1-52-1]|uniref:Transcriptional regulator, IclR family n=1 Tax=Halarchaeum acidiphilum MH1-52-1 TaxID=1261545 RepID=U3ADK3_9EURY|nr:IclR family transcriptional regulator [Halarchaeum acidiphilum]GAD52838.1 transcriptional regulator, IclR family [Halarchaeum acidiphilum MH1-52-1]